MPVIGALFGAAAGALAGSFADVGRMDEFMTQFGDSMPAGSSSVLILVRGPAADPEMVLAELRRYGGTVIRTTLLDDAEARLRAALGRPTADVA